MNTSKTLLTLALAAAASAAPFAASAAIANPDNDSGTFFTYDSSLATAAINIQASVPQAGEVSRDSLYVYSASDRGWVQRSHSFVFVAGQLAHTADCLAYNEPKSATGGVPGNLQRGVFGEHGA